MNIGAADRPGWSRLLAMWAISAVAMLALVFAAPAQAWGPAQSVPGDLSGPPYVFTDPHGGMHLLADVSGTEEWFDFTSSGALGAGQKLPGPGAPVSEVAWMPDGAAIVSWGYALAVRLANGTWGPLYSSAITISPGGMAVDNSEAVVLQLSSIQQLLIAANGTITKGSSASIAQPGDMDSTCRGAIALAPDGSSGMAIYGVGNQVRDATLTPPNSWAVHVVETPAMGDDVACPTGGSANGRLVAAYGEYDGTYPFYNQPPPETSIVHDATWVPGGVLTIATLSQFSTSAGDTGLGDIFGAAAGADGTLSAWGGYAACDASNNPLGFGELAVGAPSAPGLTSQTKVFPAIVSSGTAAPAAGAGAFGGNGGAGMSAFGGGALALASQSYTGSPGSSCTATTNTSNLFEVAGAGPGGSNATLRDAASGTGGDAGVSSATDGKGDAVVTALSSATSGESYVMFINGKPGPGSSPPVVSAVAPPSGPASGGTVVTITGSNLAGASSVTFGGAPAAFSAVSSGELKATSPPGAGTVAVVVTTPGGASAMSAADQFTYAAGGGTVTTGHVSVTGTTASVPVGCTGAAGTSCDVTVTLTVTETVNGSHVIAVSARKRKTKKKVVTVGAKTVTVAAGHHQTVAVSLNAAGKRLLSKHHHLKVKLTVGESAHGKTSTVASKTVTFKAPVKKKHKH